MARWAEGLLAGLALALSFVHFHPWEWDVTAYHLPFTARFWNLGHLAGITTLLPERYEGFPVLWRVALLPGLVLAMPRLHFAANLIALAVLCLSARRALGLGWPLSVACCLCFPIALFGFRSPYPDVFVNTMITAGALRLLQERPQPLAGLAALAVGANTKPQGLLMAVVILAVAAATGRWRAASPPGQREAMAKQLAALGLVALILLQPAANLLRFGNPFYPIATLGFPGPRNQYATPIEYLPRVPLLTDLVSFQLSASEIDPLLMGQTRRPSFRTLGMASPDRAVRSGGSNGLLYGTLVLLALVSLGANHRRQRFAAIDSEAPTDRRLLLAALLVTALPQSLELRYYLFALFAPALVAVRSPLPRLRSLARWTVTGGLIFSLLVVFGTPRNWFRPEAIRANLMDQLPSRATCLALGRLEAGAGAAKHTLVLDPLRVSNNLPFQCRLVLEPDVFIEYRPRPRPRASTVDPPVQ